MSNKDKVALAPKLRFPEFVNDGEWEGVKIYNIGEVVTGKTPDTKNASLWGGDVPFITPTDITECKYQQVSQRTVVDNNKMKKIPKGAILYTCIASIGKMAISVSPCITNQQINSIIPNVTYYNEYIYYAMLEKTKLIKTMMANTTLPIINKTEFSEIVLSVPESFNEQNKISDCLSSLDDLIAAENKKLSALKEHKKGLMQKLFPADGKTVPEWRFSEFENGGEWEGVKIYNIGEVVTGKTPDTKNASLWGGDVPFITPTDITECKYQQVSQKTVVDNNKMKKIPKGAILYTCIASIGKMAISVSPCITNQQINSIITNVTYYNEYIYYAMLEKTKLIKTMMANTTLPIINKTEFSEIVLSVPESFNEQNKISDCLSSLDELIYAQTEKIEALKTHKKGLMQGLFPSLEEVASHK